MEATLLEIGQTSSFSDVQFTVSANQLNQDLPYYELELKLINRQNMTGTEAGMDSLAKSAAIILKNSIENIQDYEWIFVLFDDPVSARSKKKTFGYRTAEIN